MLRQACVLGGVSAFRAEADLRPGSAALARETKCMFLHPEREARIFVRSVILTSCFTDIGFYSIRGHDEELRVAHEGIRPLLADNVRRTLLNDFKKWRFSLPITVCRQSMTDLFEVVDADAQEARPLWTA